MRQLPFFFLETNIHIHIRERERDSNTGIPYLHSKVIQFHSKVIVTFKRRVRQVILHTTYFLKQYETITYSFFFFFFFLRNTHAYTQGREKGVLTQRHITTPLKSHSNF